MTVRLKDANGVEAASPTVGAVEARVWIAGRIPVDHFVFDTLMNRIEQKVGSRQGECLSISSVNLDHLHHYADGEFFSSTDNAGEWLYVADGWPIARRAAKATGLDWPRLAGSDLLPHLLRMLNSRGGSLAMVGGSKEMHEQFRSEIDRTYPHLELVGVWSPGRNELLSTEYRQEMDRELRRRNPDVVLVSLPKPISEQWIRQHADDSNATVFLAFGAAADFVAGRVRRAPRLVQKLGLEWLFRLLQEPRRLARRYLVRGPASLPLLMRRCDVEFIDSAGTKPATRSVPNIVQRESASS